jgi:plasmid maintenance system antidote protein VapI
MMAYRDWTLAPGANLHEWRTENGLSVDAAAVVCRMTREEYESIVTGEALLTKDLAMRLEEGTDIPARLWLRLEQTYREDLSIGRIDTTNEFSHDGE